MNGLTPRQAECFAFVRDYIAKSGGVGPTFDEMEEGFGVGRSRVHSMLVSLEERGAIRRLMNRARAIEIVWAQKPSTTTKELADEIVRRAWSEKPVSGDRLHAIIVEALS